ncbi:MAG: putative bifunctional diguanylate cyclase/phosphodiesterase [Paracoccaceae bacterium]
MTVATATTLEAIGALRAAHGAPAAAAVAEAGLALSLVLDAEERVLWASPALAAMLGAVEGRPLRRVLSRLGLVRAPAVIAEALAGLSDAVLVVDGIAGEARAWRLVAREVAGEGPAATVLVLVDVTPLASALDRAERHRAVVQERLRLDAETGLPDEKRLLQTLDDALARGAPDAAPVGLLLVEVLDFREIVELHGEEAGAEALRRLSDALLAAAAPGWRVARGREHEFALVVRDARSAQALTQTAERLAGALSVEVATPCGSARVDTVIGMATGRPGETSGAQLLNNARIALGFRELPRRRRQIRVYEPELRAALEARSRTYAELSLALQRDEIVPFFQPQIRLSDRAVTGFEVLVRWRHPEQGLVPPALFLEIAEQTGLLARIDEIVMAKAVACLAAWSRAGHDDLMISLNCTGDALRDPTYVARLAERLAAHGLAPARVGIEILETVLFGGSEDAARRTLAALRERGFRLEIDDFGTGQASVAHLITLGADAVKLDRSLLRGLTEERPSRLVVEAVLALSRNLGLETLAEGAETGAQLDLLAELGCDAAQGFGIARPMPFEEATAWLEAHVGAPRAVA